MPQPIAMARFNTGWPLAGSTATVVSILVLGLLAMAQGMPFWMPLNATSHGLHGAAAAQVQALDLGHTAIGAVIHAGACFFWAAVAVLMLRGVRQRRPALAWLAGLGAAALAAVVDYGLLPARLTPGWELVLPATAVAAGFAALGAGIALGLLAAQFLFGRHAMAGTSRR